LIADAWFCRCLRCTDCRFVNLPYRLQIRLRRLRMVGPLIQACRCLLHCLRGMLGPSSMQCPLEFKYLTGAVILVTVPWLAVFLSTIFPLIQAIQDRQIIVYTAALFMHLIWYASVRAILLFPRVSNRWIQWYSQATQFRKWIATLLLWDLPLYMFLLTAVTLCLTIQFLGGFSGALMFWALQSGSIGFLCLFQSSWHRRLLLDGFHRSRTQSPGAPPDTIDSLETCAFDESLFGDVEDRRYPGQCSICLEDWAPSDKIKVTPCRHVFHEDCLAHWLQKACTCAVCRQDLVKALEDMKTSDLARGNNGPVPEAI